MLAASPGMLSGGIPGLHSGGSLADYVNALFTLSIVIGSVLSVLLVAYSGFEYMTTDAILKKKNAKSRISHAIGGLMILLAIYLIFAQINPDILKLEVGGN